MDYTHTPTTELLEALIGREATEARYEGDLRPLFESNGEALGEELAPLFAARELVRRWLTEELKTPSPQVAFLLSAGECPANVKDVAINVKQLSYLRKA